VTGGGLREGRGVGQNVQIARHTLRRFALGEDLPDHV
jgi:hypothetical protein